MEAGDEIIELNGQEISSWMEAVLLIQDSPNEQVNLTLEKENGSQETVTVVPESVTVETGEKIGRIGIQASLNTSFGSKIMYGFTQTWFIIRQVLSSLASIFTSGFSIDMFGGPVAIYATTEAVAKTGITGIINWLAVLSLNLFIINLLPIPALDGGKILLNFIEGVRGKPLSEEKEGIITLIGVGLMVLLMIAVTWNDIQRFFLR